MHPDGTPQFMLMLNGKCIGITTGAIKEINLGDESDTADMPYAGKCFNISVPIKLNPFMAARIIPDYWPWRTIALMNERCKCQ